MPSTNPPAPATRDVDTAEADVAIIGTGFAGLGAAIRLLQEGMTDIVVLERADEVGGVWRENRYPGCACDTASHLYSFSFAPKADWSRRFAGRDEIFAYLKQCATQFGVRPHIRFGHAVRRAVWDEEDRRWHIETSEGTYVARALICGVGAHSQPLIPDLPGQERFEGRAFHSSGWPEGFDPSGRRVAVVGTGASAVQIVPALQPHVEHLTLFQRTPAWVVPHGDREIPPAVHELFRRVPMLLRAWRFALHHLREATGWLFWDRRVARLVEPLVRYWMRSQISDPDLRETLIPDYALGCKRILHSDTYLPALSEPNVTVVDGAAREVHPEGVSGPEDVSGPAGPRDADVIVYCTGFQSTKMPLSHSIYGREGRALAETWGDSPRAHLGTTVAGYPNLFLLRGPNTGLGHNSILPMIEAQIEHILGALRHMGDAGIAAVEPRAAAQARFVRQVDRWSEGTVWTDGGCRSWYLDATGRNAVLWPRSVAAFRRRVTDFDPSEYATIRHTRRPAAAR
ncbi:flavin-containing monooxygenase [Salinibacter ruber]|uniref:flavin-containing monooxygenase n=1 Tax=Salinibacter ruber TaxID=146919 RepID=UPI000C9FEF72|nr:NAD(P)/FAD-dependent oxidoreductase [Salinibacter ruber]MCS3610061.1 cation diffusion facilitator CzcD-associated flavoprotein CzcO [Salinibacter ruber]MCS3648121.1 cation diffusion facilitator CzcD-associated flavoprotein CzcO [Salinibacter ruber]